MAALKATTEPVKLYLSKIKEALEAGDATEHTHRPALKDLIEILGADADVTAVNEPKRVSCGAPDYAVKRRNLSIGYIEAKDVGRSLDEAEDSPQLERYKKSLHNLILTDYLEFRWYVDGEPRGTARLARQRKGKLVPDKDGIEKTIDILSDFLSHSPEPIADPQQLSERLARLAHIIRDTIVGAFEKENASQDLRDLREAFAEVLIPDLNRPEKLAEFADMYAQTIVYGLFAARCNHQGPGPFQRLGAAREIPKTNPFLKKLFESITGSSLDEEPYVDFVEDLVAILANTDMEKVLENFGKRTGQEDPIVHFYETFLAAYDPKTRERRGVYYTPEPVVQYIVKSVDHILKTRFGLEGGLAHTADVVEFDREEAFLDGQGRPDRSKLLKTVPEERPKVLILDPACGTGTFLYVIMDHIRSSFMGGDAGLWSAYVKDHLLPRLFGFEILMAPYAVAHFKLGMMLAGYDLPKDKQKNFEYDFSGDERLGIYLTNTLDEAVSVWEKLYGTYRIISEEASLASVVKRDLPIMVILGNPPYSIKSQNLGEKARALVHAYRFIDGKPIKERGALQFEKNIQNDYIKFIRYSQLRIEKTGYGIVAFITDHSYLDNPTMRGVRYSLLKTFDEIYILNLHGNHKKKERCPDGTKDENVFEIEEGTAISIFIKYRRNVPEEEKKDLAEVKYSDLWGPLELREYGDKPSIVGGKFYWLNENCISTTKWEKITPVTQFYLFTPMIQDSCLQAEYDKGWKLSDIMPQYSAGIITARDNLAIDFDKKSLLENVMTFRNSTEPDKDLCESLKISLKKGWDIAKSRRDITQERDLSLSIKLVQYRPFDIRYIFYHPSLVWSMAYPTMKHMLVEENIGLSIGRAGQVIGQDIWDIIFCTKYITDFNLYRRGGNIFYPLYLYPDSKKDNNLASKVHQVSITPPAWPSGKYGRMPNLSPDFIDAMMACLGLTFISDGRGDLKSTFGPEDILYYIYAIFYSPTYRMRYKEFLSIDFPKIPLTSDANLFRELCMLGKELTSLALLESPLLQKLLTCYPTPGNHQVHKGYPKYIAPEDPSDPWRVYINPNQYFEGVPPEVWTYHIGGYQICEKWLKDRRGRQLSFDDLMHYQKVVVALKETIRLMGEIDRAIPGWPME